MTMLTPVRKAISRWRSPPGTTGIERLAAVVERPGRREVVGGDQDRADAVDAARLPALVAVARRLGLDPELAAVPAAREAAQQVERLGQHVVLGHRLQARNVEVAEQPLQRRAALAAHREAGRHALAVVLGVEDDHAALLHVGVDLGQRRLGQRAGRWPAPASTASG